MSSQHVRVWFRSDDGQPLRTIEVWDEPVEALLCAEEIMLDEDMFVEDPQGARVPSTRIDDSWPSIILPAHEIADMNMLADMAASVQF